MKSAAFLLNPLNERMNIIIHAIRLKRDFPFSVVALKKNYFLDGVV